MFRDDDSDLSTSSQRLDRADGGKKERQMDTAKAKGEWNKLKLLKLQTQIAKGDVKNADKQGKQQAPTERKEEGAGDDKKPQTFGTKTHMEMEKQEVKTAMDETKTDEVVEEEARQKQIEQASSQEYQKDAG